MEERLSSILRFSTTRRPTLLTAAGIPVQLCRYGTTRKDQPRSQRNNTGVLTYCWPLHMYCHPFLSCLRTAERTTSPLLCGLVCLWVVRQLRVEASLRLPNSCEHPFKGEDYCRGNNSMSQQTLLSGHQALWGRHTSQVWADGSKTRSCSRVTNWQLSPHDPPTLIQTRQAFLNFKFKEIWESSRQRSLRRLEAD